jgi:hypothetical protein
MLNILLNSEIETTQAIKKASLPHRFTTPNELFVNPGVKNQTTRDRDPLARMAAFLLRRHIQIMYGCGFGPADPF